MRSKTPARSVIAGPYFARGALVLNGLLSVGDRLLDIIQCTGDIVLDAIDHFALRNGEGSVVK